MLWHALRDSGIGFQKLIVTFFSSGGEGGDNTIVFCHSPLLDTRLEGCGVTGQVIQK